MYEKGVLHSLFVYTKELFDNNKESIIRYNSLIIPKSFIISIITLIIPIFISIFRDSLRVVVPVYLMAILGIMVLFMCFKVKKLSGHPLIYAYIFGTILYTLFVYLSIFRFTDRPAGTALVFFVVVPLIFVDRSIRMNAYVFILFIIHLILSYTYKDSYLASIDLVNTLISSILGMLFGRIFLLSRLYTFDVEKQLVKEKETDFLTSLYNRRKLYSDIDDMNSMNLKEVGIMLLDLDYFKEYNDKYGHLNGDRCLEIIGNFLKGFEERYPITFYRYGGEEFVGLTTIMNETQLVVLANKIREQIKSLEIPIEKISASIGIAICKDECYKTIDHLLDKADKALYNAKNNGRDRVETLNLEQ